MRVIGGQGAPTWPGHTQPRGDAPRDEATLLLIARSVLQAWPAPRVQPPDALRAKAGTRDTSTPRQAPAADGPAAELDPGLSSTEARNFLDRARLAHAVYGNEGAPEGFTRLGNAALEGLGLDPADFHDRASGLDAALFREDSTGEHHLAFRGSEAGSLGEFRSDWLRTNAAQALGHLPDAYRQGSALATEVKQVVGADLQLVGHSMGGGIANYAGIQNNLDFTAFNAAGLSTPVIRGMSDELARYSGQGVVINDQYDPLTNLDGRNDAQTLGGRHVGHDRLIFVRNDDFGGPLSLLDPRRRTHAHSVDGSITDYLTSECLGLRTPGSASKPADSPTAAGG